MAYIKKFPWNNGLWSGPFPNKRGEFCGNIQSGEKFDATHFRTGRPSNCASGTSKQMSDWGFVGLYLIADSLIGQDGYGEMREVYTDMLCEEVVSGQRAPRQLSFELGVSVKGEK